MAIEASSVQEMYQEMKKKIGKLVPDVELRLKAELAYEINRRKKETGALILGHNYMEPALFVSVPDFVGDSLYLSRKAAETEKSPIIFCGVRFMAETAKILNPTKKVLLPAEVAGCSLAAGITADDVRALKAKYPGVPVIAYINTYADVKAEVDVCCTSGNFERVAASFDSEQIIFLPDQFMGTNLAKLSGRNVFIEDAERVKNHNDRASGFTLIGWTAKCEVHEQFTVSDIVNIRKQVPGVFVVSHPECSPEVVAHSDASGSTSSMVDVVRETSAPSFLLLTECSMADNIMAENPDKEMVRLCSIRCPHMNEITLEDTLKAINEGVREITVPSEIADRARKSVERMLLL